MHDFLSTHWIHYSGEETSAGMGQTRVQHYNQVFWRPPDKRGPGRKGNGQAILLARKDHRKDKLPWALSFQDRRSQITRDSKQVQIYARTQHNICVYICTYACLRRTLLDKALWRQNNETFVCWYPTKTRCKAITSLPTFT